MNQREAYREAAAGPLAHRAACPDPVVPSPLPAGNCETMLGFPVHRPARVRRERFVHGL